jgi:hypothetical protein
LLSAGLNNEKLIIKNKNMKNNDNTQKPALSKTDVISSISDNVFIELYRLAYNDGFDNIGDKKDVIKHRQKQIDKVKKKYCL